MKWLGPVAVVGLLVSWLIIPAWSQARPDASASPPLITQQKSIEIYHVPKAFQEGYVTILRELITESSSIRFPQPADEEPVIFNATESIETDTEAAPESGPPQYVHYDPARRVVVALASAEEHEQIKAFFEQLQQIEQHHEPVFYRMAMVERDIHPKLKDYPFEFRIEGAAWDDGRYENRHPKWMNDIRERYSQVLFSKIDIDKEDDTTRFWIEGFAEEYAVVERIFAHVEQAEDTDSDTQLIQHDFMEESEENLHGVLTDIFPDHQVHSMIKALQQTKVYQVDAEAILASEGTMPGLFRSVLGDGYGVEIRNQNGVQQNERFSIQVTIYNQEHDGDGVFDERNIHLTTTLLTRFRQINMMGIRHHDDRYVLLFSMEPTP